MRVRASPTPPRVGPPPEPDPRSDRGRPLHEVSHHRPVLFRVPAADPATDAVPDIVPAAARIADCPLRAAAGPGGDPARPARGEARCHHPGGEPPRRRRAAARRRRRPRADHRRGHPDRRLAGTHRGRGCQHRPQAAASHPPPIERGPRRSWTCRPPMSTAPGPAAVAAPSRPHAGRSPCSLQCSTSMWTSSVKRAHRSDQLVTGFGPTRPATFDGGKRRRDRR